ncbi:hypothetical protein [Streptomyces lydicus]|uniref:hypothetical protein n=1 Tax=Streptomyces lydicus TaxID=47763 RepID=UPI001011CCA3|nr:hypothetical protein [Streptomyces lydicus]MCZ1012144.1 hypothetical protein [Streptomyces lydicus]
MPDFDLAPVASMLADWVEGAPDDSLLSRRTRLRAYVRVGRNRFQLGMLLYRVAFDLTLAGRNPALDPTHLQHLIVSAPRRWEDRHLLGAELLHTLEQRGVSVAVDRFEDEQATEASAELLATIASDSGDPDLKGVDWTADEAADDFHFGGA